MAGRIAYYGNISPQGLVLNLDAAIVGSYPRTGSTWFDISNNGNNGTLTNGPTFTGSDYGAIVFDGTNDYVNMPLSVAQGQGDQTYSHWIKITASVSSDKNIFFEETAGTSNFTRIGSSLLSGSYFQFGGRGTSNEPSGNGYFRRSSSPIVLNLWTNVVGMWDVTNSTIRLYMNGSETSGSFSGAGSVQTHANTTPGTVRVGSSRNSEYFLGSISNIQVYNSILTPFQVWQNFNAYKSRYGIPDIVTDGLVLNLDAGNPYSYLSGSSGTTWTNTVAVSSSISGTLVNGTTYSNGAMVFDGVDDYVTGSLSSFNVGSISLWINPSSLINSSTPGTALLTLKYLGSSNTEWYIGLGSITSVLANEYITVLDVAVNTRTALTDGGSLLANTWYNLVFNIESGTYKIYLNGVKKTETIANGGVQQLTTPNVLQIAALVTNSGVNGPFQGKVAITQLYNRALTQDEITQNFNALRGRYGI